MTTPRDQQVPILTSDYERRELYRTLDLRRKLAEGQAYLEEVREMSRPPPGNFSPGASSRMVLVRLATNDYPKCLAHHYVSELGDNITEPDPKWIAVDNVIFKQGTPT